MGLPVILQFPYYDKESGQLFPFRTVCMLVSFITHIIVSLLTWFMFEKEYVSLRWDILNCFQKAPVMYPNNSFTTNEFAMDPIPRPKLTTSIQEGENNSAYT